MTNQPVAAPPSRPIRTAELLAVGSELTTGETRDTNGGELARSLAHQGVGIRRIVALPDELPAVTAAFTEALRAVDLVVATGGLGPTPDDLTREVLAQVLLVLRLHLVELAVAGDLYVNGTQANHVTFTSNNSSPAKGNWQRIHIANTGIVAEQSGNLGSEPSNTTQTGGTACGATIGDLEPINWKVRSPVPSRVNAGERPNSVSTSSHPSPR